MTLRILLGFTPEPRIVKPLATLPTPAVDLADPATFACAFLAVPA